MPKPTFTDSDYENPYGPPDECRLRADHPLVRDRTYDNGGRVAKEVELWKGALMTQVLDPWEGLDPADEDAEPGPSLDLFIKERPRGVGYLADFIYKERGLPVTVYGTLVNDGAGVVINELELWRESRWEYRDRWGDYVGPDGDHEARPNDGTSRPRPPYAGISTTLLRQLPLGRICAAAQAALTDRDWEVEGIKGLMGPDIPADELPKETRLVLETVTVLAEQVPRRGRPSTPDSLLEEVARAYLKESAGGVGLTRRLAERFDRPEPTVRDWISKARARGYLSPAQPGRRGARPGPRLDMTTAEPRVVEVARESHHSNS